MKPSALAVFLSATSAFAGDGFVMNLNTMAVPLEDNIVSARAAARLGATHFNIPVPLCQKDRHANRMGWCNEKKESATYEERLRKLVQELTHRGWTVGLFPFLMADDGTWRGNFEPADFGAWSRSYLDHLLELTTWVKDLKITDFIVGSELTPLYTKSDSFWRTALSTIRSALNCKAFVVANWDAVDAIRFWDASDYIGTSSYFPLAQSLSDNTTVDALTQRWKKWSSSLIALSRKTGRKLYFAELGYSSRTEAARRPWDFSEPAQLDLDLQSRLFLAFTNAWAQVPELARFTVWALADLATPLKDTGFAVIGKPAAQAVAHAFRSRPSYRMRAGVPVRIPLTTPVIFAMDDLPMWFVRDSAARVAAFQTYRTLFSKHSVPAVAFVNTAFFNDNDADHSERDELRQWMNTGFTLGNHSAHHHVLKYVGKDAFLADVDAGEQGMNILFPGWDALQRLFRFPNLDAGAHAELAARRYRILDVTFDTRDWSWSEAYHHADATERARITQDALDTIRHQFKEAAAGQRGTTPLTLLLHSTEFMRDHLEEVLELLESLGARWANVV